jgi:hypothetical protein
MGVASRQCGADLALAPTTAADARVQRAQDAVARILRSERSLVGASVTQEHQSLWDYALPVGITAWIGAVLVWSHKKG